MAGMEGARKEGSGMGSAGRVGYGRLEAGGGRLEEEKEDKE